ncbi:MAG: nucleotide exchange factor GrpE, partial [Proteobacteria bacterium]|nr:nucleotide exchange factor GrpE [Pseudomonadota bacterium]
MSEPIPQPETTTAPAAPAKTLEELLAEAEAKVQEQRDAWLRALADAENARKRAQTDIASAHKYGVERLAEALVPVMDSLQAALAD